MKPMLSYFGGKWRFAKTYQPPHPDYDTLIEPFAGSAGYSLRYHHKHVVLVELSEELCRVWRYLIGVQPAEIMGLPDLGATELVADLNCSEEAKLLIGFWVNKGAPAGRQKRSKWGRNPKYANSFWGDRVKQTLAAQVPLIRHWEIRHGSYEDIDPGEFGNATWFVDPPYKEKGKYYPHGSADIDYPALATWCQQLPGRVIVCEQWPADWLPFVEHVRNSKTTLGERGKPSTEAVWNKDD